MKQGVVLTIEEARLAYRSLNAYAEVLLNSGTPHRELPALLDSLERQLQGRIVT